ncbi:MAG TPA: [Fe-Fe] hydrogenase large subunit C-terminal domain-containing protein [Sedimentisphaerales bacterium]|nr:[Fe-Fe] hydrogenase large subunit C-terminal domain-containing protein [Sedimentisphaerales bacterium]HNU30888.1 [Fe-Fe] hydrogenase large subunit C-terminal domain-containing protein [Sedimentisphaerales bacterium]
MEPKRRDNQVVFTNKARCKDCYRCIRVCPVGAIGVRDGQAYVDEDRCISCGTCIRECPQGAKSFRRDLDSARELIASGVPVAVSLAPSFAALFNDWQIKRVPSALRRLGFSHVSETAVGAYPVAQQTAECAAGRGDSFCIATACPAVVNYVERYRPDLVGALIPVCSPMVAHARMLKAELGHETRVVFIGPCVAKKQEAREKSGGAVDFALTFTELLEWLEQERVDLSILEESDFDMTPEGWARSFPLAGGSLQTASLSTSLLAADVLSVTGTQEVKDTLDSLTDSRGPLLVEPLFCEQGCINGPAMPANETVYQRRKALLRYVLNTRRDGVRSLSCADLSASFRGCPPSSGDVTEEQIRQVFAQTGKENPEDQLNCGACGYSSCREQAIAVVREMAEPQMCVSYMRRLAEQRTDRIIETSPNGIVILDEHLSILHVNPSFKRLFMCSEAVYGKPISYLMDPEPFEQIASGKAELTEVTVEHAKYSLICHQIVYALREEKQYVGVFVNLTSSLMDKKQLDVLRARTVQQARDLLAHQIEIAGKIARFLGESTAEGEKLLENLVRLTQENPTGGENHKSSSWLKDTYTST